MSRESLIASVFTAKSIMDQFIYGDGVTTEDFCNAIEHACKKIMSVATDITRDEAAVVLNFLMNSEEERQQFCEKYDIRSEYDAA